MNNSLIEIQSDHEESLNDPADAWFARNPVEWGADLNWLARNQHSWPADKNIAAVTHFKGTNRREVTYLWVSENTKRESYWIEKGHWEAERAKLQNKPPVYAWPEWAICQAQDANGEWHCFDVDVKAGDRQWDAKIMAGMIELMAKGQVLGDWRNTLEKRPESSTSQKAEPAPDLEYDPGEVAFSAGELTGIKHDTDKPRMDLIPPHAEMLLAKVLTFGATKYAPENWRLVADLRSRYIAAAMRHINAWRIGEEDDPETGLPHLAHAMCNLAFIVEVEYLEGYTPVADAKESPNDPRH